MLRFGCTACGRCCHDLRLRLSIDEAARWIDRGGTVEVWCDALPTAADFSAPDMAQYRARAFAARSGTLDIVVGMLLVATFTGPCPNLQPDMRCGDYAGRPNICRIYPAEIVPGQLPNPEEKRCPPEAWSPGQPPMFDDRARIADEVTRAAIEAAATANVAEVSARAHLAARLGIATAALRHEGFAAFRPQPDELLAALRACRETGDALAAPSWRITSPSANTRRMIEDAGATAARPIETAAHYYISLVGS